MRLELIRGLVAIIGRPNVGKSTLFNRLTRSNKAIVIDSPGVTRDRLYGYAYRTDNDDKYLVIDTGGFETEDFKFQPFKKNIVWEQTKQAIAESNLVVMLFDGKDGLHPHDEQLVRYLQRQNKLVIYAVNKIDGPEQQIGVLEFYSMGIEQLLPISSAHSHGIGELREQIEKIIDADNSLAVRKSFPEGATKIALIGRPNVGKSSLLNRIIGEKRALVSDVAGTTRDIIDTLFNYNKRSYILLDTAGIRKKAKVNEHIETISVIKSLSAIEEADVVVLVIDAVERFSEQDARLASFATSKFKPVIIIVNKWDLITEKDTNSAREYALDIKEKIKGMFYIPILFVSCRQNQRVFRIMSEVERLSEVYGKRIPTSRLNQVLEKVIHEHTPALVRARTKLVKFYYATQVKAAPPTFVIKCNFADEIQESYKRYIANKFRSELGFDTIPVHLIFRGKDDRGKGRKANKSSDYLRQEI